MSGMDYDVDFSKVSLRMSYVNKFKEFMSILSKHNNDVRYAQAELEKKFGDTYWYYQLYHQPQELSR